jgi:hypothetical protein
VLGDAAKLYRLAGQAEPECRRALLEGWRTGGVLGIPPVVVRSIELAEDLLAGLCGEIAYPVDLGSGLGQGRDLLIAPKRLAPVTPGDPALLQGKVAHRTPCVPPTDHHLVGIARGV